MDSQQLRLYYSQIFGKYYPAAQYFLVIFSDDVCGKERRNLAPTMGDEADVKRMRRFINGDEAAAKFGSRFREDSLTFTRNELRESPRNTGKTGYSS